MAVDKVNRVAFNSLITGKNTEVYPMKSGIASKDSFVKGTSQAKLEGIVKGRRDVSTSGEVPMNPSFKGINRFKNS